MALRRRGLCAAAGTVALALAVAAATAGTAAATGLAPSVHHGAAVVARVEGRTHVLLGPATFGVTVQQDPLAYEAVRFSDGTVQGHWLEDYYQAGVLTVFSGRVTCLTVAGNRAWVGGTVDASSDPTSIGMGAWWQVADLGSGPHPVVPDQTTFAGIGSLAATAAYCQTAPAPKHIFDVQSGWIIVRDLSASAP